MTPQVKAWAVCAAVLFFKMMANTLVQGFGKLKYRRFEIQEDAALYGKGPATCESTDLEQRAAWCWENDLENIPIFLFVSLGYVLVEANPARAPLYMTIFCASRFLYMLAFLFALQPWRTLCYYAGVIVTLIMTVGILTSI